MRRFYQLLCMLLIILALAACQHNPEGVQTASTEVVSEDHQPAVRCPDERPAACTLIDQAVCGFIDTGVRCVTAPCPSWETHTYSNGCSACTDIRVVGFSDGVCPRDAHKRAPADHNSPGTDS